MCIFGVQVRRRYATHCFLLPLFPALKGRAKFRSPLRGAKRGSRLSAQSPRVKAAKQPKPFAIPRFQRLESLFAYYALTRTSVCTLPYPLRLSVFGSWRNLFEDAKIQNLKVLKRIADRLFEGECDNTVPPTFR